MAIKKEKEPVKQKKVGKKEEKQKKFLEKLGFVQMVFDFYNAPVN